MLAQMYHMKNKYANIPKNILNDIDKMGMDDSLFLTEQEGKYCNAISGISKKEFDFHDKKVAFFTGNIGSIKINKKRYFTIERERLKMADDSISYYFGTLYIFDTSQKKSCGYDAAIVYMSKKLNSIKEMVKRLKKTL